MECVGNLAIRGRSGARRPEVGALLGHTMAGTTVRPVETEATQAVCYVTTRGRVAGRDHTIEIWYVEHAGCVFLLSGYRGEADWVKNLRAHPQADVDLAPDGPARSRGGRSKYAATVGPFAPLDELAVRQAIDAAYNEWRLGQALSTWAAESLLVRLEPEQD